MSMESIVKKLEETLEFHKENHRKCCAYPGLNGRPSQREGGVIYGIEYCLEEIKKELVVQKEKQDGKVVDLDPDPAA